MNLVKKKQIEGLETDLSRLQYGTLVNRSSIYTGDPSSGEVLLNSSNSGLLTEIKIHTNDNLIGNSYYHFLEISKNDKLIIKDGNNKITVYLINSITSEVDSSYEGYFILTVQHSFGYNGSLSQEESSYYFRRATSASIEALIEDEEARAIANEESIKALTVQNRQLINNLGTTIESNYPKKYVILKTFTLNVFKTITHNLNSENVIVQIINSSGELISGVVNNYTVNTVDIKVSISDTCKIIIIG